MHMSSNTFNKLHVGIKILLLFYCLVFNILRVCVLCKERYQHHRTEQYNSTCVMECADMQLLHVGSAYIRKGTILKNGLSKHCMQPKLKIRSDTNRIITLLISLRYKVNYLSRIISINVRACK